MSIEAISWAFNTLLPNSGMKLTLLALCNYANEDGEAYPSQKALAEKTCLCERAIRTHLVALEDVGLIARKARTRANGSFTSDLFQINIGATPSGINCQRQILPTAENDTSQRQIFPNPAADSAGPETSLTTTVTKNNRMSSSQAKRDPVHRLNGKKSMIAEIASYLNLQAQRNFRIENPNGTPTAGALVIEQRLKEGYTVAQCKDVIGVKSNEWMGDEKMHQFLNPETLFRKKNFTKYLAQAEAEIGGAT